MFNLVFTIICTEEPSAEDSYHMEISQLICFAKHLAGFLMVLVFAERYFHSHKNGKDSLETRAVIS